MKKFVNVLMEEREQPKEEIKQTKGPYDWRYENSIINGKEKLEVDKDYSQWRTNSVLSNYKETIYYANEMSKYSHVTDQMHYDCLFHAIRKQKLYSPKESKEQKRTREKAAEKEKELISLVSSYYKYNIVRSKEVLKILSPDQIDSIRKKQEKGGVK